MLAPQLKPTKALKPRPYQRAATEATFEFLNTAKGNPIVAMPTGSGKSLVIAMTVKQALDQYPHLRVIKLTHVKTLIQQNLQKLLDMWPSAPVGVYSAGLDRREIAPITFAGIATVAKLAKDFGFVNMVLIDEAHMVSNAETTLYQIFINELRKINPYLVVVGYSATPWRMGLGQLIEGGIFTDTCFDNTAREAFNELITEGYLCRLVPKSTQFTLDTNGVHTRGGEFVASELEAAVNQDQITYAALQETMLLAHDRKKWIVFTAGVAHCEAVAEMLVKEFGINARPVHSKLGAKWCEDAINDFKYGDVQCLVNNNMLTTGVDFPMLDCIVILRPTKSSPLWVQILGRGTRTDYGEGYGFDLDDREGRIAAILASAKQDCLVLDFAKNTRRLGPINDPVMPKARGKGGGGGDAPVKVCEACNTYNHATVLFCEVCGEEFHRSIKFGVTAGTDALIADGNKIKEPIIERFKVDIVSYMKHETKNGTSMKVNYGCGLRFFNEYVCLQHEARLPLHRARMWWRERFPLQPGQTEPWTPESVAQALQYIKWLRVPTHIDVHVNRKYPEIVKVIYAD